MAEAEASDGAKKGCRGEDHTIGAEQLLADQPSYEYRQN
jgi:hypothetical protein